MTIKYFEVAYFDCKHNYITEAYETYEDAVKRGYESGSDEFDITEIAITFNKTVTKTREMIDIIKVK